MTSTLLSQIRQWPRRRWAAAAITAILTYLVVAIPTDLINTPFFAREVPPTWWSQPALIVSALLSGLLVATYVAAPVPEDTRGSKAGGLGAIVTFFAVGCPVCNKIVLIALGSAGAMQYFEPIQPLLAVASVVLLTWAIHRRVTQESRCAIRPALTDPNTTTNMVPSNRA